MNNFRGRLHSLVRRTIVLVGTMLVAAVLAPGNAGPLVAADPARGGFRFAPIDERSLGLWEGDRPVLVYNHQVIQREGVPEDRWRSTYVHPLYGLDGEVLTDDFPRDHYHHRGLFWAWPHVRIDGRDHDLWTLGDIRQRFERWQEQSAGAEQAVLAVENGWYLDQKRVVKEEVRLVVATATQNQRTIDVQVTLTALEKPVTLAGAEGKGYGGLSLRFAPRKQTTVTTENGQQTTDANLARLVWADLSAQFQGAAQPSGAALIARPQAGAEPPLWITREYGFLGVGWPEPTDAELEPGVPRSVSYRVVIHRGLADASRLKQVAADFMRGQSAD